MEDGGLNKEKVDISYETLWKSIIRPPKEEYDDEQLGDNFFSYHKIDYVRNDYNILNKRGYILKCSFLQALMDKRKEYIMPVVIYLHGNSSSRLEGLKNASELLKKGINIFTFDFSGCGQSEGEYISLGWHEKDDVRTVIDFLEKLPGVGYIGLWGRSMGAATAMLYAYSDSRIKAICMDSPFAEFKIVAKDLCKHYVNLPDFILDATMSLVKNTVKEKCNLDLDKLKPFLYANKTKIPAFFVHAINDELIALDQTLKIYELYAGEKSLHVVEGGHNSARQKHVHEKIAKFFDKYLNNNNNILLNSNYSIVNNNIMKEVSNDDSLIVLKDN